MPRASRLLATTALTLMLTGCAAPIVIGAAATGAYVGLQERTAEQVALDTKIKIHVKDRLVGKNYKYLSDVGVTVFEGDVLLTGIVPDKEAGEEVLKIAQSTPDAQRVYNELFVGAAYSTKQKARDTWTAAQIKPRLMGNRQTFPINYSIDVVNGHVYIIGYVTSDEEHEHVLHILRTTKGVQQVHDYLRLSTSGEDPRKEESYTKNIKQEAAPAQPDDPYGN